MILTCDLTRDWSMPADSYAGVFGFPSGRWAVAWGKGYEGLVLDDAPEFDPQQNTSSDGIEWFASQDEAMIYADQVRVCQEER